MTPPTTDPACPTPVRWIAIVMSLLVGGFVMPLNAAESPDGLYRWQENGQVVYGDSPPARTTTEKLEYVGEQIMLRHDEMGFDNSGRPPVILLTKRTCRDCNRTRALLYERRVPFREFDVELSTVGEREYRRLRADRVPVVMIGRSGSGGYDEARLTRLLDEAGY
jgi:glutaredoxin